MAKYTFKEEIKLNELAERIVDTADHYELMDAYGTRENAINEILSDLKNDPLSIIESLVNTIEELL